LGHKYLLALTIKIYSGGKMGPTQQAGQNELKINNRRFCISFISVTITLILTFLMLFSFPVLEVTAAERTFTNATTAEADIKAFIQTELDKMSSNIIVKTEGVEIAKLFLETDSSGKILEPINFKNTYVKIFSNQIRDLNPPYFDSYNSYTYLALAGWNISASLSYSKRGNEINQVSITIEYNLNWRDGSNALAARNAVTTHAKNFLNSSGYKSKTTDDEKLKAINEYICRTFQYDYRLFIPGEKNSVIYSAYQMINDTGSTGRHSLDTGKYPRGVCQAYAMYGYIMLREAGYTNIAIEGNKDPNSGQNTHVWNLIRIGDFWYHMDFTWNDPVREKPPGSGFFIQDGEGIVSLNYFLRSDEEMRKNHDWDEVRYPASTQKWEGVPEMIEENPPPVAPPVVILDPEPTKSTSPSPTPIPTVKVTPTIAPSSSQSSSSDDEDNKSQSESEISEDKSQSPKDETSSDLPTATPVPISMVPNDSNISSILSEEKTVTISGFLYDGEDEPLSGMLIELFATSMTRRTTAKGYFEFKGVKVGNYKIYLKDNQGNELAELPVVISFGDITEYDSGEITVKGGKLDMNLVYEDGKLSIKCVSSPDPLITIPRIIGIVAVLLVLVAFLAIVFRKKEKVGISEYLE